MDPYTRQRRFIDTLWPYAAEFETSTGIPASWAVAMAANETGWDADNPVLFGIKGKSLSGQGASFPTWEVEGGERVDTTSQFATYEGFGEAFQHLASEMGTERYKGAPKTSAQEFATYLQSQGWATDPEYAAKIGRLAGEVESLRPITAELGRRPPGVEDLLKPGPEEPTDVDDLLKIEREALSRVQVRDIARSYQDAQSYLATRAYTIQRQLGEAQQRLAIVQRPTRQDLLADIARVGVELSPRAHLGPLALVFFPPDLQPRYSPEHEKQVVEAAASVDLHLTELDRIALMQHFLAAAPAGWASGDWSEDFEASLQTFTGDAGLVDALEPGELEFLRSAWEAVTQMPRMMTEEQFAATTEALQAVPRARPVRAGLLSRDELIRSLTGRAEPGPLPRGVTSEAYLQMAARRGLSAEELSRLKDLQGGWRKYAEEYAIQRGAIEAYRAGMAQPQIKELSGWEYLKLGLVQPAYLGYEALVAWNQNAQSLIGTSMRYKTGYSPVLGTAGGALIGAGVGGAYGAVVGGAVGLGVGTWTKFTLTPELERQYQEVLRRNPSTSDWEAAGLAWQNIPGNDALKLIMEVVGDPTNVLGIGLGTRIFGRVSVLGKIFGAVDRGWMKFWDIATPPLVGALAGGVVTGEPWGAAAGAGLFTAMRVPVRTFTQSALRHSLQGASLLKVLAAETKRAEQGVFALPSPQPTAQDMLKVARLAAGTLRKDPTPAMHTNLHKLGLYVFQAGFRPPLQAVTAESSQMWRSVGNLAKALGRELPTGLQMHNIMDALWSNIGKGTYFTRDEIAQRIASTLGLDPLALAKKVGRRRDVTVGKLISVWVRRFEDNVFAEGMQAFKDRRVGGAKALEDWIDQLQNNTMEWFRHPSYRVAEAEGVWGGLRRFEDAVSRDRFFNAIDRFNYTMAKQALLFVSYGPWNVAENIIRMGLGGISPFGMWFKHPGTWLPTAMDVTHFLNAITADLTNVRPFVKFESERAMQTPVLMGAMPKSTQETMLGVRGKVLEGSDLPYGQRSAGLLHPLLDYLPGVSISLPGFLRDVLPRFGGERWAAALEASWLGRKLPEQFWSLRHFNAAFQDTGQKLQSWYLLNMFQRQLQQVAPDTYGRIMAAVGSPAEVPDLAKHLPLDVLRALHTKLTGYALYGDPDIIRGLRLTPQELTMVNLRQRLLKTLQGFPELGPQMQNAVLAAVETGELRPGMSPEKVQDFFHRLWAGWMDNTVVGRLEYQALAIEQVLQDLLAFSPQNADEMFRVVRYMGDVLQTADHSLSENLDFVADRGDQLSTKERHKLWGTSWAAAVHMAKKLDVEYKVAVRKINALLDGAANLPMDTSQSHFWSKGITGQATVAGKARSQTAVVEELAAQNRIKLWADSLPVDLRIGIRSVQVNPKATTPAQVLLADGTLRLELKSLATTQTEFHHAIASHLVGSKKILDAEFMDQVQKALPGTTDEQLTDALTQHLAGVDTPLRVLFDEHFPTRLPNLVLTSDQVRLMKQYNAHLISLADAYLPVRQAQQELHQKVYAKGGDPHLYPKYLPIVRAAWDKYQAIRAKAQTLMQATEIALGETYGLKVQPQVLRVPPSGTLTPSDVAYMWNQFPSQLIRDLIDPTTLQLTGRSSWTTKQMTRARRLVANTGKTLPDFGIDEEALGKVYDNLLVSIGLDPTNAKPWAASQAWFDGMRRDVLAHLSTVNIHPDASSALDKYLDDVARKLDEVFPQQAGPPAVPPTPSATSPQAPGRGQGPPGVLGRAPTPGGGLPRPGLAAWRNVRAEAMDQTNLQFARDFPDYDNMNLFDSFMRSIYPFWLYERERYPWTIRTFARRPAVALTWAKYMENSDDGYWQIPGTMLQANPLRGTVFAGGYSRLFRKDYPEYYDQFPQTPYEQISNLSRMGFYPNASYTIPEAVFGGAKPQTGGVLPPYAHTFLGSLNILPNHAFGLDLGHYKSVILDYIFPDRYRDYRVQQVLQDRSLDGIYIMNKRARGQPLTDAEQSAYNSARDYVLGVSGVLDSQFGMFRLRSEDRQRLYAAYTTAAFALSGVPPEAQERLRRRSAVTNTRLTDVLQLDPLDQWVMNQYLAPDSRSRNWLRPQTTPLLPSMYGEMQSRTLSYYDEVDKVWSNAREHGFPIYDREGNETSRTPSAQVLEQQFRSGKLKADDYTHQLAEVMRQAEAATKAIGETDYYRDLPKTRKQREDWLQLHGMPTPTYGPGQELLWEYYNLRPQVAPDEDGVMRYDWDMYYAQVDALLDALTPETRQRLLARIQAEWTDTQRLYWQVSREYLAGYRNIRNVVREQLDTEGQKVVERYYKADVAEKRRLEAEETSGGLKLISQYNQSVRQMRENLRLLDPDLDAWLLFWGKANKPLSEAATHRYNELLDLHRPGAEKIIWQ